MESGIEPSVDLETLDERIKIREMILKGHIQEAIALVNSLHPELLDTNRYLYFHLQVSDARMTRQPRWEGEGTAGAANSPQMVHLLRGVCGAGWATSGVGGICSCSALRDHSGGAQGPHGVLGVKPRLTACKESFPAGSTGLSSPSHDFGGKKAVSGYAEGSLLTALGIVGDAGIELGLTT